MTIRGKLTERNGSHIGTRVSLPLSGILFSPTSSQISNIPSISVLDQSNRDHFPKKWIPNIPYDPTFCAIKVQGDSGSITPATLDSRLKRLALWFM